MPLIFVPLNTGSEVKYTLGGAYKYKHSIAESFIRRNANSFDCFSLTGSYNNNDSYFSKTMVSVYFWLTKKNIKRCFQSIFGSPKQICFGALFVLMSSPLTG